MPSEYYSTCVDDAIDDDQRQQMRELAAQGKGWRKVKGPALAESAMEFEREVGRNISHLREARQWSQSRLAEEMRIVGFNMHQTTIAKIENGKRPLRVAELDAFAVTFDMPPEALMYVDIGDAPPGVLFMRERLQAIDEEIQEAKRAMDEVVSDYAAEYAFWLARRADWVELMAEVSRETEGSDVEHQAEA